MRSTIYACDLVGLRRSTPGEEKHLLYANRGWGASVQSFAERHAMTKQSSTAPRPTHMCESQQVQRQLSSDALDDIHFLLPLQNRPICGSVVFG